MAKSMKTVGIIIQGEDQQKKSGVEARLICLSIHKGKVTS
jgi:hypothetical protein